MELLLHSIEMDWPVLLPILLCAILTLAAAINRFSFYNKNKRDVVKFIRALKTELVNNRLDKYSTWRCYRGSCRRSGKNFLGTARRFFTFV